MEEVTRDAPDEGPLIAIWGVRTVLAAAGMLISFLVADDAARAQLSGLGVGGALMQVAPLCAGGGVLAGWYWGSELAGIRYKAVGVTKWAESLMCAAQGALAVATSGSMLLQQGAISHDQLLLLTGIVVAWALPIPFGFVWAGGSLVTRGQHRS